MSLDVTFVYSFVIVLLSAFTLKALLFDPVSGLLEARDKKLKDDAHTRAKALQDASARAQEYEARIGQAKRNAYLEREAARRQGAEARGALMSRAREETDRVVQAGKAAVKQASVEATGPLMGEAERLAGMVVSSILGRRA